MTVGKVMITCGGLLFAAALAALIALAQLLPSLKKPQVHKDDLFTTVHGSRMRYRVSDKGGRPLIFLHGFGETLEIWEPLQAALPCGRAIAIDLIGFGSSDRPDLDYHLESHRHYVIGFMDRLGIQKAVLVGTSMGASIALWTAAHNPERVDAIAAFAPSAYPGSLRHQWPGNLFFRPNLINRMARLASGSRLYKRLFPNSLAVQALDITASYNPTFLKALRHMQLPTLLVWSERDRRVPIEYSAKFKMLLPQAIFLEAPCEAGHRAARYPTREIIAWICSFRFVPHGTP